jgi:hypothetical protein
VVVVGGGPASHGTVTCDERNCTYTPDAGFTGADGFPYSINDSSAAQVRRGRSLAAGRVANAAVHILVAPGDTSYALSVNGRAADPTAGGAVPAGGLANWLLGISATAAGITGEELGALPLPTATATPSGPHRLMTDEVKTARGWTATTSSGTVSLAATKDALLGEGVTEGFPKPLPPISQGTGGDGHVPILVGTRVFAFYHHSPNTSATCVDRATGTVCPGYPKPLDWGTDNIPGPGAVVGSKIYTRLVQYGASQTTPYGMYCWDAEADTTCGYIIAGRRDNTGIPGGSAPVLADGKMWFGADDGKLYCVDPSTQALCPAITTGLATTPLQQQYGSGFDIVTHGTRVYLSRSNDKVACIDVRAGAACPGWETPKSFDGNWNLVNYYNENGSGEAIGVCVIGNSSGSCVPDADPTTSKALTGWPGTEPYYSVLLEGETGTRTLMGSLSHPGMGCFDWTTFKPCAGGGYDSTGWLPLPYDQQAYGVAWDGSCAIGLGDPGRVYTVDPDGSAPCLSLRSGAKQKVVDLRDQRCDGGVGNARWQDVTLSDTNATEMESVTVTVRDAQTKAVLATGNLIDGDHKLNLAGIDPTQHPSITIDATAKGKAGNTAWDDSIPPRITLHWKSDPRQACVTTRGGSECGSSSPLGISMLGHLAEPARDEAARLDLLQNACPAPQALPPVKATAAPRVCGGLRLFRIHVRYPSNRIRSITVTVNRKKQKVISMKGRPVFRVDLRRLGKQRTTVRIVIRTKSGTTVAGKRVYQPCTKKLPDHGFKL